MSVNDLLCIHSILWLVRQLCRALLPAVLLACVEPASFCANRQSQSWSLFIRLGMSPLQSRSHALSLPHSVLVKEARAAAFSSGLGWVAADQIRKASGSPAARRESVLSSPRCKNSSLKGTGLPIHIPLSTWSRLCAQCHGAQHLHGIVLCHWQDGSISLMSRQD